MHKITHFVELIEHGTKVKVGLDEKMLGAFPLVPLSFTTPTNSELCFTPMEHTMPPVVFKVVPQVKGLMGGRSNASFNYRLQRTEDREGGFSFFKPLSCFLLKTKPKVGSN